MHCCAFVVTRELVPSKESMASIAASPEDCFSGTLVLFFSINSGNVTSSATAISKSSPSHASRPGMLVGGLSSALRPFDCVAWEWKDSTWVVSVSVSPRVESSESSSLVLLSLTSSPSIMEPITLDSSLPGLASAVSADSVRVWFAVRVGVSEPTETASSRAALGAPSGALFRAMGGKGAKPPGLRSGGSDDRGLAFPGRSRGSSPVASSGVAAPKGPDSFAGVENSSSSSTSTSRSSRSSML